MFFICLDAMATLLLVLLVFIKLYNDFIEISVY